MGGSNSQVGRLWPEGRCLTHRATQAGAWRPLLTAMNRQVLVKFWYNKILSSIPAQGENVFSSVLKFTYPDPVLSILRNYRKLCLSCLQALRGVRTTENWGTWLPGPVPSPGVTTALLWAPLQPRSTSFFHWRSIVPTKGLHFPTPYEVAQNSHSRGTVLAEVWALGDSCFQRILAPQYSLQGKITCQVLRGLNCFQVSPCSVVTLTWCFLWPCLHLPIRRKSPILPLEDHLHGRAEIRYIGEQISE